jgi:CRP-like cAMP-binding protein
MVNYKKNSIIHLESDPCNKLEIILSGTVVIERIDESGDLLTIAEFHPDDMLSGNLIFSKMPYYPMTVTSRLPSIILEMHKDLLLHLCFTNKDFLQSYLEFISDHTLLLSHKIKHYVNRTIRQSLISFLKYEYKKQSDPQIKLGFSKKVLAEKIGVQRTSLSRELQKMKKEGLIDFDASSITLLNTALFK